MASVDQYHSAFHRPGEITVQRQTIPSSQLHAPAALSRAEYWSFLGAAGLLAFIVAAPQKWQAEDSGRRATGAFGTRRSSDEPRIVQRTRAREAGRGRHARAPLFFKHDGHAATFADPTTITKHLSAAGVLPTEGLSIFQEQVARLTAKSGTKLSLGFVFGLGLALWSANSGMKAIMDALNVVYEEKEKRSFITLNLASLALTVAGLASIMIAIGAVAALPILLAHIGLSDVTDAIFRYGRWPVLIALVVLGLAVVYRFGPSRREPQWKWLSVGSVFAAVAWLCSSALLSWYLSNFAHYDATYGSLGAGIGMMMWMWISFIVLLFGAELNSEIEHQTAKDTTAERERPRGDRGAVMADTVGKAW